MATEKRIKYLERKVNAIKSVTIFKGGKDIPTDVETKYRKKFERNARYLGYGVYEWQGVKATDTRALFLKGVLTMENIKFKEDKDSD